MVGFVLLEYADDDSVWDVQEWVFLDRFNFSDGQSEDHHDQAVSFFKVRVVKKQFDLPYSCARRTTCCAVEADISIGIPPQSSGNGKDCFVAKEQRSVISTGSIQASQVEKIIFSQLALKRRETNHQVMSSVLGNNKSAQSNQFHPRKYRIGGTSNPISEDGNQGT